MIPGLWEYLCGQLLLLCLLSAFAQGGRPLHGPMLQSVTLYLHAMSEPL